MKVVKDFRLIRDDKIYALVDDHYGISHFDLQQAFIPFMNGYKTVVYDNDYRNGYNVVFQEPDRLFRLLQMLNGTYLDTITLWDDNLAKEVTFSKVYELDSEEELLTLETMKELVE